jgi:hypothetical protein
MPFPQELFGYFQQNVLTSLGENATIDENVFNASSEYPCNQEIAFIAFWKKKEAFIEQTQITDPPPNSLTF